MKNKLTTWATKARSLKCREIIHLLQNPREFPTLIKFWITYWLTEVEKSDSFSFYLFPSWQTISRTFLLEIFHMNEDNPDYWRRSFNCVLFFLSLAGAASFLWVWSRAVRFGNSKIANGKKTVAKRKNISPNFKKNYNNKS